MSEKHELMDALRGHLRRARGRGLRKLPAAPQGTPEAPSSAPRADSAGVAPHSRQELDRTAQRASESAATSAPSELSPAPGTAPGQEAAQAPAQLARELPQVEVPRPEEPSEPRPAPLPTVGSGLFSFEGSGPLAEQAAGIRAEAARAKDLDSLAEKVASCTACDLCQGRTKSVFMDGQGTRSVMFVGEGPGEEEDLRGVPFVGKSGQLLTDIIEKGMKIRRAEVTIANVVKCRPPGNRDPLPQEKALCTAWLDRQIELVDPQVIVGLGRHATGHLLSSDASMGRMRGQVHERGGRKIVGTYHPAYLLREPGAKRDTWQDIQLVMKLLGLPTG